jgi:hypothetical protein
MHALSVALVPANEQTVSDTDLEYKTSSVDTLGIGLRLSDRDSPDCRASDRDSAVVFLLDSSTHFPEARSGRRRG